MKPILLFRSPQTLFDSEHGEKHLIPQILADKADIQRIYVVGTEGGKRSVSLATSFAPARIMDMRAAELIRTFRKNLPKVTAGRVQHRDPIASLHGLP